eukprot:TRINITY_DN27061_c0_g1_i1.p1 TRINITY_DN27061_c0_g1~~TRINITY_DN27061_c0_g1_i1.p1  ORF type:complete len:435 (-),score=10.49 TRINITY_DN27061_c0_g1_i1:4-1308(-)
MDRIGGQLLDALRSSELVKAAAGLIIFGGSVSFAQQGIRFVWNKVRQRFMLTLELNSKDESYTWLVEWLSEQPYSKVATQLMLETTYDAEHGNNPNDLRPRVMFTPSVGFHSFTYRGKYIWLWRDRDTNAADLTNRGFLETITISIFGRDRKVVQNLVNDAMELSFSREEGKTVIYTSCGSSWRKFGARSRRPMDSVILDRGVVDALCADISDFLGSTCWYRDMGIPYHRGYLFYGVPGSGKTSFIFALAGQFRMNICMVNLSDKDMSDDQLNSLLNSAPPRSILLLEDIDAAFVGRANREDVHSRVTFSGLLNALDGVAAQEGRVLFMTTNKHELLDPALIRPGRADMAVFFGVATHYQADQMLRRFYPEVTMDAVATFVCKVQEKGVTMAELQGYLLRYRTDLQGALDNLDQFLGQLSPQTRAQLAAVHGPK